jgi:hypothetical protein
MIKIKKPTDLNAWQDVVEDNRLLHARVQVLAEVSNFVSRGSSNLGLAVLQEALKEGQDDVSNHFVNQ